MNAKNLKRVIHLNTGNIYTLEEIGEVSQRLKLVSSKVTEQGIFYLYRDTLTKIFWVSGPLKNQKDLFLALGERPIKGQLKKYIVSEVQNLLTSWILKSLP